MVHLRIIGFEKKTHAGIAGLITGIGVPTGVNVLHGKLRLLSYGKTGAGGAKRIILLGETN